MKMTGIREGSLPRRKGVAAAFDFVLDLMYYICSAILAFAGLIVIAEIVMRYFFGQPFLGTVEMSGYALVFITFLPAAWLLRGEGHVVVDVVISRMSPKKQHILNIINSIIGIIICLVITWYSTKSALYAWQTDYRAVSELELPLFPILITIPIGTFLLAIQFIRRTFNLLKGRPLAKQWDT